MKNKPFVSLLMPIRNEAAYIDGCLKSVLSQDYPKDCLEIIVADGMSTDNTREIVTKLSSKIGNVRLIDNMQRIVSTGLNAALREAKGEIIVRVDGHCEIAPDYVTQCVKHLQKNGADGVGGPIETIGETFWAKTIAVAMSSPFGVGGSAFRTMKEKEMFVDTVAFPAYSRRVIENAGLFDEELVRNQDDEYNYRLRSLGYKLLLAPDIHSRYYSRSSIRSLWRQYFQYGYWKVRVMQKHPRQMSLRQFVPLAFVLSLLLSGLTALIFPFGKFLLITIVMFYMLANLIVSARAAMKTDWKLFFALPLAFTTLHIGYGSGFLIGLFKFWHRWSSTTVQRRISNTKFYPTE